jgi:hypothetical protein
MPINSIRELWGDSSKSALRNKLTQIPPINKIFWITVENNCFAHWKATFSQNTRLSIRQLTDFILRINILGASVRVCDIIGHGKFKNFDYSTVIQEQLENISRLTVFDLSIPQSDEGDFFYAMGAINYFETFVRSRAIVDAGQLLRELRPDDVQRFASTYMVAAAPVTLKGFAVNMQEDGNVLITSNETIEISLMTDIWFPWVVGFMEEIPTKQRKNMYDNRQLAFRHTPRLNDYLKELRALTDSLDMTWELSNVHPLYSWMVSEKGINLDMQSGD